MRKLFAIFAALVLAAGVYAKQYDQVQISGTVEGAAAVTNTATVRGEIMNIYFDVAASTTGAVTITAADVGTILQVSGVTSDTLYIPRYPQVDSTGSAIGTNNTHSSVVTVGTITAVFDSGDGQTTTNKHTVKINIKE